MTRKSGCGCVPGLLGFGLLCGVVAGGHYLAIEIDKRRFPWGYADSGTPPLVGTWVGPVTTGSGKRLASASVSEILSSVGFQSSTAGMADLTLMSVAEFG